MKYNYTRGVYGDGTTAVRMYTDIWEPYADVSVNLSAYGLTPKDEDHIFMPVYRFGLDMANSIADDIAEEVIEYLDIGDFDRPCLVWQIRLKDREKMRPDSELW